MDEQMTTSEKFDLEKWAKELCLLVPIVCPDREGLASVERSMRNCLIEGFQKAKELYEPQLKQFAKECWGAATQTGPQMINKYMDFDAFWEARGK